jgi:serine/threonine-protein kinase HipA
MTLARQMKLPVAPVTIRRLADPILLIERFDRKIVWTRRSPALLKLYCGSM